jgi:hypothetical protein
VSQVDYFLKTPLEECGRFPHLSYIPKKVSPMPKTSPKETGSAYPRENPKHWIDVEAEDIPQGWMDDMVKRLFDVLNRRMIRLETAQACVSDAPDHVTGKPPELNYQQESGFARLAAQMRNDLEKLRKIEMKRQSKKPKVTVSDDEARAKLEREIDRIVAAETAPGGSKKTAT